MRDDSDRSVHVHLSGHPEDVAKLDKIITAALTAAGLTTTPPRRPHLRAVPPHPEPKRKRRQP